MKYIIIMLMGLFVMSCSMDVVDNFSHPEDYPGVAPTYINTYGAPSFIDTVTYDNGVTITRAVWDSSSTRAITSDDIVTASFVDGSVVPDMYAQLGTEQEVIQPYIDTFGVMDSSTVYLYDGINQPDYYIDANGNGVWDTGEQYVSETNFRGIDIANGTIDYNWNGEFVYVYLEHLVTLQDGTKIYGIRKAIDMTGTTFTSISL